MLLSIPIPNNSKLTGCSVSLVCNDKITRSIRVGGIHLFCIFVQSFCDILYHQQAKLKGGKACHSYHNGISNDKITRSIRVGGMMFWL
jgi:hypothetical protein